MIGQLPAVTGDQEASRAQCGGATYQNRGGVRPLSAAHIDCSFLLVVPGRGGVNPTGFRACRVLLPVLRVPGLGRG